MIVEHNGLFFTAQKRVLVVSEEFYNNIKQGFIFESETQPARMVFERQTIPGKYLLPLPLHLYLPGSKVRVIGTDKVGVVTSCHYELGRKSVLEVKFEEEMIKGFGEEFELVEPRVPFYEGEKWSTGLHKDPETENTWPYSHYKTLTPEEHKDYHGKTAMEILNDLVYVHFYHEAV